MQLRTAPLSLQPSDNLEHVHKSFTFRSIPADGAPGWTAEERGEKRHALRRLLNATVGGRPPGEISYYQGLHDVAAVLLFVAGERAAAPMLARLAVCHLRDCTRCGRRACTLLPCCW